MAEALLEKEPKVATESRSRAAEIGEHFAHGVDLAKKIGRVSNDAAEEWMDDNIQRIKRHPAETVVGAFAAGIVLGGFLSWLFRRK